MPLKTALPTDLISKLSEIRADLLVLDAEERDAFAADEWPQAAKWTAEERDDHVPLAVLKPASTEEVSRALAACNALGVPVVPVGARSGVVGGIVQYDAVAVDLRGLDDVIGFSAEDATVTVGAGVLGGALEAYLQERGFTLGHYPQSLHLATIGGLVATRSSGTFSSKYGNIEDRLLALEVVLADGTVVSTKQTARSSTGPSAAQLFVGSEGTLGVITAVSLRVIPQPASIRYRAIAFDDLIDGALSSVHQLLQQGIKPAVIRLYEPLEAEHLLEGTGSEGRSLLVLAFDGLEAIAEAEESATLQIVAERGGTDLGPAVAERWSAGRYNAAWIAPGNAGAGKIADAIEISGPWSRLAQIYQRTQDELQGTIARVWSHFSHFYLQGGSLYVIIFIDVAEREEALRQFTRTWRSVMDIVVEEGGSISHHHGIGTMRLPWLDAEHGTSRVVLERIKAALDPESTLNPGMLRLGSRSV